MPKYIVDIHRTYSTCVIVDANSAENAEDIVSMYIDDIPGYEFEKNMDDEIKVYEEVSDEDMKFYKHIHVVDQDGYD